MTKLHLYPLFSFKFSSCTICFAQTQSEVSKNNVILFLTSSFVLRKYPGWLFSMKSFIVIFLTILSNNGFSQNNPSPILQNLIPPSPTASALGKFGDIPVSYSTGLPNISVSLYDIKSGAISIPISLNYHAGGIKVEEVAGWAGLGWALDCGGVITRTVKGLPDEYSSGYFSQALGIPDPNTDRAAFYSWQPPVAYQRFISNGYGDTEPDMYFFNFMGNSGKLIIDKNQNVSTAPYKNYQISSGFNPDNQWVIKDEIGTTYIFGGLNAIERSSSESLCGFDGPGGIDEISSWYLTTVISSIGDTVSFEYYPASTCSYIANHSSTRYDPIGVPSPNEPGSSCKEFPVECDNLVTVSAVQLKKISWKEGALEFVISNRDDFNEMSKLDKIILKNRNGESLKTYYLRMSYFISDEKRLKLSGVTIFDAKNAPVETYSFEYEESIKLPSRLSKSQDYWGFYNGKPNTTLIPSEINACLDGADRTPDSTYTKANILNKITYPTGGYTQFAYELNKYGYNNNTEINTKDLTTSKSASASARWNASPEVTSSFTIINPQCAKVMINRTKRAGSTNPDPVSGFYSFDRTFPTNQNMLVGLPADGEFHDVQLLAGTYVISANAIDLDNFCTIIVNWNEADNSATKERSAGGLRIKSITDNDGFGNRTNRNFLYVLYEEPDRSSGVLMTIPKFNYVGTKIKPSPVGPNPQAPCTNCVFKCSYMIRQSAIVSILGSTQGSHVSYSEVVVENRNGSNYNGKSWYSFTSARDYADKGSVGFPFPPRISYDWRRGLLKGSKDFNADNVVLKTLANEYYFNDIVNGGINFKTIPGIKISYKENNPIDDAKDIFEYVPYEVLSEWFYQTSSTVSQYDKNGLNPISIVTKYYYDNPLHAQLTRTVTNTSEGKLLTVLNLYPADYTGGTLSMDNLKSKHIVAVPIEQVRYQTNELTTSILSGQLTQYRQNGQPLIDKVYKLETVNPIALADFKFSNSTLGQLPIVKSFTNYSMDTRYKEEVTYNQFDDNGNPLMLTQKDRPSAVYLWSYSRQSLIAEIKNTTYATVASILGASAINTFSLNPFPTTAQVESFLAPLRSHPLLVNSSITTYSHKPLTGKLSQTDPSGRMTSFEYDSFQRLMNINDNNGFIIKNYQYNYGIYLSEAVSQIFTRSNCAVGGTAGTAVFSVAQGTYTSAISQADANSKAAAYLAANGTVFANSAATCTFYNTFRSQTFVKNDCPANSSSGSFNYTVNAGTFSSLISQDDADAKAQNMINTNGQATANSNLSCMTCSGIDKKIINGVCETGAKVYTGSTYNSTTNIYSCAYRYEWSDGSTSITRRENSPNPCQL